MDWVIRSPGRDSDIVSTLLTKTSGNDYEKLCGTAVLGLERVIRGHPVQKIRTQNFPKNYVYVCVSGG